MNGKSVEIDNTDAERRLVLFGMFVPLAVPINIPSVDVQVQRPVNRPS